MNSTNGFDLINNLINTILAKCIDYSTIHVKFVDSNTLHANSLYTIQKKF